MVRCTETLLGSILQRKRCIPHSSQKGRATYSQGLIGTSSVANVLQADREGEEDSAKEARVTARRATYVSACACPRFLRTSRNVGKNGRGHCMPARISGSVLCQR